MYRNTNWVREQGRRARAGAGRWRLHGSRCGAPAAAGAGRSRQLAWGARSTQARGPCGTHAGVAAGASGLGVRPGRAAGPTSCALGALGLFLTRFDSVVFLSQFLDIVREPGS